MLAILASEKTRPRHLRSILLLGACLGLAVVGTRFAKVNLSASAPRGVYRLASVPSPLPRGTLVVLPVPVSVQPWHSAWIPLLKPVAGVAGDKVCVSDHTLFVAGTSYGPVEEQARGQWLPQWLGCVVLSEGEVFLASAAPRSLDARYWGPTPIATLTAQAIPVLTWR